MAEVFKIIWLGVTLFLITGASFLSYQIVKKGSREVILKVSLVAAGSVLLSTFVLCIGGGQFSILKTVIMSSIAFIGTFSISYLIIRRTLKRFKKEE